MALPPASEGGTAALLRHLHCFFAVAEEHSLQAAAARLNIAQSAISRRIRLLELELGGIELFERNARGMRLLPAGEALLATTRTIFESLHRTRLQVASIASGKVGRVRAGFVEVATRRHEILDTIQAFSRENKDIEVDLEPMLSEQQRSELASGILDVGILYHDPAEDIAAAISASGNRVEAMPLLLDPFVIAVSAKHRLVQNSRVHLADLEGEPIIWSSHKVSRLLYERMLAACRARAFTPRIVMETQASDTTLKVVAANMGIGFVPASLIGHVNAEIVLLPIEDFPVAMQLSLVWQHFSTPSAATAFAKYLRDHFMNGPSLDRS